MYFFLPFLSLFNANFLPSINLKLFYCFFKRRIIDHLVFITFMYCVCAVHQAQHQVPLPTAPSHWLENLD